MRKPILQLSEKWQTGKRNDIFTSVVLGCLVMVVTFSMEWIFRLFFHDATPIQTNVGLIFPFMIILGFYPKKDLAERKDSKPSLPSAITVLIICFIVSGFCSRKPFRLPVFGLTTAASFYFVMPIARANQQSKKRESCS